MQLFKEVSALLHKEVTLELRRRSAINGLLLYVVSTVFVCYISFRTRPGELGVVTWNALFWIILLFAAVNAATGSFARESGARRHYLYMICSPRGLILSKMAYNFLLLTLLALIGQVFYGMVLGSPVQDLPMYVLSLLLGTLGFSIALTMVSAIANRAEGSGTLMAILGFPILLPMLLMLIRLSKNAADGLDRSLSLADIYTLLAMDAIVLAVALLLFPYLWRT